MDKLGLNDGERGGTTTLLQRKLRDGGRGLTPPVRMSPAVFLDSLARCHTGPVFLQNCGDTLVSHGWLDDNLQRVRQAAQGDEYQANVEPLLPVTAGSFFELLFHYRPVCHQQTPALTQCEGRSIHCCGRR